MLRYLLLILCLGLPILINCQPISKNKIVTTPSYILTKVCDLPSELSETSGIVLYDSLIWTFNDSGGDAVVYALEPNSGKIMKSINISNGHNKDWEDIAQNKDYIFIGDFGNNDGSRKDLRIYSILKTSISGAISQNINAGIIDFVYSDQEDFTPALFANPFDCEAMVATKDSIYIFTKDWLNLKSTMYSLPIKNGKVTAKHVQDINSDGLVTGADLNKEDNRLVLCGYNLFYPFIIVIDNFSNMSVLVTIELEEISGVQVEGIASVGKNEYLFTNEKSSISQSLHKIVLKP